MEFATSSAHTAYDSPSSLVSSPMSEHVSRTPPTSEMDPEVHLRNMEEELIQNRLRTDRIEATLQAILNKLDTSQHGMQDMCSDMGELTREEGLSYAVCAEEVANSKSLSPIPNAPMVT